jgi:hypothetical protein
MLKTAFGEQAMGRSQTFQWFSQAGKTSIDYDERFGRPVSGSTPEMIVRERQIIREDRRHSIDDVSMPVGISHGTCHKILKMRPVASKFMPRLLSVNQKQQRLDICLDLKENATNDLSFLLNVTSGDETHSLFPKSCLQHFITFCSSFPLLKTQCDASALWE